jgi:hypothetical protein
MYRNIVFICDLHREQFALVLREYSQNKIQFIDSIKLTLD